MATMQNNIEAGPSSGKSLEAENQPGMRLLLIIYILALSFTSAFLSFTFIAVPLVVAMVASCALFGKGLVTGKISAGLFRVEDLALVAFIFVGILSLLLGGEGLLTKNIQYTGRYVGVIGFYLFVIAILASRASRDTLLKWLVISVAVASHRQVHLPAVGGRVLDNLLRRACASSIFCRRTGVFRAVSNHSCASCLVLAARASEETIFCSIAGSDHDGASDNLQRSRCRGCNRGRLCGLFRLPGEEQGEGSGYGPTYLKPCILFAGGLAYLGMVRRLPCADN